MNLAKILIFPIKALDPHPVERTRINAGGILEQDRVFAIFDHEGKVVNGKRTARIQQVRCSFDEQVREIRLWHAAQPSPVQFPLDVRAGLERWLSDFLDLAVTVRHESEHGFPDDREAFGPTIVSTASLEMVRSWYPGLTLESMRRRFRSNLELQDGPAFCEDQLYGAAGTLKPFRIGPVAFHGHNPCQRCVVPTRDPDSAEARPDFQKEFMRRRKELLPEWADVSRFNHFYRFAVNTSMPASEAGKTLQVGDPVTLG